MNVYSTYLTWCKHGAKVDFAEELFFLVFVFGSMCIFTGIIAVIVISSKVHSNSAFAQEEVNSL